MRYELRLAKLIEKGLAKSLFSDLPVEVLAVIGRLGSPDRALRALQEKENLYPLVSDRAAFIIQVPLKLMETVTMLNKKRGPSPLELVELLRSGHLGMWPSSGSLKEAFVLAQGTFPISKAAKFH